MDKITKEQFVNRYGNWEGFLKTISSEDDDGERLLQPICTSFKLFEELSESKNLPEEKIYWEFYDDDKYRCPVCGCEKFEGEYQGVDDITINDDFSINSEPRNCGKDYEKVRCLYCGQGIII